MNVREKSIFSKDNIKDMFEKFRDTSRVDQKQIQKMAMTNEAMVELCLQLMNTNHDQVKKVAKLISPIEALTKILASNITRAPPQEDEKKENSSKQYM